MVNLLINTRRWHIGRWFAVAALVAVSGDIMAEQPSSGFPPDFVARLQDAKEIYVATERKDGTRSQVVPVWFGFMDNAIWFTTGPDSHKGKRVKKGSPMYVSVQGKDGPFIKAQAEIVKDGAIADRLGELYSKKYWIAWLGFFRPSRARNDSGKTILLRLTPAE
jgi:pyridoxamine 5'-phosphate oxidase-like protein